MYVCIDDVREYDFMMCQFACEEAILNMCVYIV
jgi:hypothetical protein